MTVAFVTVVGRGRWSAGGSDVRENGGHCEEKERGDGGGLEKGGSGGGGGGGESVGGWVEGVVEVKEI